MATSPADRDVLPAEVKPLHYQLLISNLELGGGFSYVGHVKIELSISAPTKDIVLNSTELKLKMANISGQESTDFQYDEKRQRVAINFANEIAPAQSVELEISFTGTMNTNMAGFYRSKYKPTNPPAKSVPMDGEHHLMFSTQFESCDARRAFPCFDEPNLKATFDVSIEIPDDLVALSNMPESKSAPATKEGHKIVEFERTPKMSTYLLAWTVADLKCVETFTTRKYDGKQLPVRVYTTPGLEQQGQFGAEVAAKIVDFYSDVFKIEYPLPKVDLVAVHEFSHNAMENWGLITYRTTAILYDPETSDVKYQNKVAYVVAHELAHQWFGNLVTMDWWNELWLNEGFATWVGYYAVDHFFPEYQVWPSFIAEQFQTAQNLDALRASHAVEVGVRNAKDIEQVFDAISYLKGSSVIRMLVAHLGIEPFLAGIAEYLKTHAYGNAKTIDLWKALSQASGKDVPTFMDTWIRKIGFPVVTVAEEPGQIGLKQSRFLSSGDATSEEDETLWWIPLGLKTSASGSTDANTALTTREETIRNVDESFYKINSDQVGFYRTNYPPARLAQLGVDHGKLSVEDRIGLIADAAAMAIAGLGTTPSLLTFLENFQEEPSYAVWTQIVSSLSNVRSVFSEHEKVSQGLKNFTLRLITPAIEKLGWNYADGENYLTGQLRSLLVAVAGDVGHEKTVEEAKRQFKQYTTGDSKAIHPNLRSAVFRTSIRNGGKVEYDSLKEEFAQTTSVDGKEICLVSMGQVSQPDLANDFLTFLFSKVAVQDIHFGAASMGAHPKARQALWNFIQKDWEKVQATLSARPIIMDRFIKTGLSKFASHDAEKDLSAFFETKDTEGWNRAVVQAVDSVRANAKYRERDEALVLEWLESHNYA